MSRLIFCYDGPLKKDEDNEYYGSALTDELWQRYEVISEDINIAIRTKKIEENENEKKFSRINSKKYKIIECPNISSVKGILFNRNKCKEILKKEIEKSDYVIARLPSVIGNLAVDVARKLNKPYLVEVVGCPWDAFWNHSLKGKLFAPIMTMMTKKRVKNAPYVLYVTKEFLQKRYPTKGKSINCSNVLLNDIDEEAFEQKKHNVEKQEGKKVKILATTAAVDVRFKGQQYVIKAMSKLKQEGKIFEYWVIGGGDNSYLKSVAKKYNVEDQVKFIGSLPHDKVFEKLKEVDIYIQPSKQEGLPRALIEAMSIGCLCIGSKTGGIPELLDNKYIFPKGDVNSLKKILKKVNKQDILAQMEKNFEESKKYKKDILHSRRTEIYKEFANNLK